MSTTEELTRARLEANRTRGEYLTLVHQGIMSPPEVIWWATQPGKGALKRITIKRLMSAIPGNGERTVNRFTGELANASGSHAIPSRLTIGWLVDRRAGGRRLIAFANLIKAHSLPWAGFPYTPKPGGAK